jgi:hypothetical protein
MWCRHDTGMVIVDERGEIKIPLCSICLGDLVETIAKELLDINLRNALQKVWPQEVCHDNTL